MMFLGHPRMRDDRVEGFVGRLGVTVSGRNSRGGPGNVLVVMFCSRYRAQVQLIGT